LDSDGVFCPWSGDFDVFFDVFFGFYWWMYAYFTHCCYDAVLVVALGITAGTVTINQTTNKIANSFLLCSF